jgi:hypothetical protein
MERSMLLPVSLRATLNLRYGISKSGKEKFRIETRKGHLGEHIPEARGPSRRVL